MKKDSLRAEGAVTFSSVQTKFAEIHDTAVHVPGTTLDGSLTYALSNRFELGLRGSYADDAWYQSSAIGTMPVAPNSNVWGLGPEMRLMVPLTHDERFALGFAGNYLSYQLPVARWALDDSCGPPNVCSVGYRRVATDVDSRGVINLAAYLSGRLHRRVAEGFLFGGLSAHQTFKNDGFTDAVSNDDGNTLESDGVLTIGSGGYALVWQGARFSVQGFFPLVGSQAVDYGPGLLFSVGGALHLADEPEARPTAARAPTEAE